MIEIARTTAAPMTNTTATNNSETINVSILNTLVLPRGESTEIYYAPLWSVKIYQALNIRNTSRPFARTTCSLGRGPGCSEHEKRASGGSHALTVDNLEIYHIWSAPTKRMWVRHVSGGFCAIDSGTVPVVALILEPVALWHPCYRARRMMLLQMILLPITEVRAAWRVITCSRPTK
jgi:hypothetical protein